GVPGVDFEGAVVTIPLGKLKRYTQAAVFHPIFRILNRALFSAARLRGWLGLCALRQNGFFSIRMFHAGNWFQSTPLREERRLWASSADRSSRFQSTLLREERHVVRSAIQTGGQVSIHAPARGATGSYQPLREFRSRGVSRVTFQRAVPI